MQLGRFGFEAKYGVEWLDGRPAGNALEFRQSRSGAGGPVLETHPESRWLKVIPADGEPWVGGFECGPGWMTEVFATPSPWVVSIVARGQGFWVPVLAPSDYETIRTIPVVKILSVPGSRRLVFVDHTRLEAYGPYGRLWLTERLSWDGLKVTEVTARSIRGMAWDSPANREVTFSVDMENGASEGGSSPSKYGVSPRCT